MKIFLPLLDNGNGDVKKRFSLCFFEAFKGRDVITYDASDSHADRGMNKIANAFLASDCDVWVNLDADIHFTRADVDNLLSHDAPLVYGIYPKKQEDTPPCLGTFADVPMPDERELARVRRCGRGFMLVRRALLEAMKEDNGGPALRYHNHGPVEWNFFESGPVRGQYSAIGFGRDADGYPIREWISEDWMFCERARDLGVETLVDVRIALGHEGSKVYRFGKSQLIRMDSNITSWRDIHGWFDYEDLYRFLVSEIPDGGHFAEVGCWLGRSLAAFAAFASEAGKSIGIYAVDTFSGAPANDEHAAILGAHKGDVFSAFSANMSALGVSPLTFTEGSPKAAARFDVGKLDAVFIDADHHEEAVFTDIQAWLPKVKPGGIMAGHDIDEAGVRAAVDKAFPDGFQTMGRCWFVRL